MLEFDLILRSSFLPKPTRYRHGLIRLARLTNHSFQHFDQAFNFVLCEPSATISLVSLHEDQNEAGY